MSERKSQKRDKEIVELLKRKECAESSSVTEKRTECSTTRPRLKTLSQARHHEIGKVTADLKAALPDLKPSEVRRYHLPYHEAILLELEEEGFKEAAYHAHAIFDLDEKIGRKTPGMLSWKKPYLKDQKDFIDRLRTGFVAVERAGRKGDYVARAMALLDIALFFQSKTWEWWWIAERLFQGALTTAEMISDESRTITLIKYLYGRFLFDELQNQEEAVSYLNEARKQSENKPWNASKKLGQRQASIFKECNALLHKALLIYARKTRSNDPNSALKACTQSLARATDTEREEYVSEALFELGRSYLRVDDVESALKSFSKFLAMVKRIPDVEGICNGHMELAFTYKKLDDSDRAEKHLRLLRENATDFGLTDKLAHAHYYTGEHYLSKGKPELSTSHLETALSLYNDLGMTEEADQTRSIAGISKGQERIKEYLNLLLQCGERQAVLKICGWKNRREPFWKANKPDVQPDPEVPGDEQFEMADSSSSSQAN